MDPLHVALLLLTVVTISRIHQHYPFLAALRPALLLVGFSFLYAVVNPRLISQKGVFFTWPPKAIAAFAAMGCLSVPFGISSGSSGAFILQQYLPVLVYAGLLIVAVRRTSDLYALVWAFVTGAAILAFFADYVFHLEMAGNQARLGDMYMFDANDAGLVLTVAIPLTLLTLQSSRMLGKVISLVYLYWEWVAIARTGSRGAFLGVVTVGVSLLLLADSVPVWKRLLVIGGAAGMLIVAAPTGYWEKMRDLSNPTSDYNWTERDGRKQVAERGLRYMMTYPVTGLGINNFGRAEGTLSAKALNWMPGDAGIKWSAPHNSHIEAGAELGIPGLLIWLTMLIGGVVSPIRIRKRLPGGWRSGTPEERFLYAATSYIAVSMIGFIVTCTFVSFTYLDPVYILLAFTSGLYVCTDALQQRPNTRRGSGPPRSKNRVPVGLTAIGEVVAVRALMTH